MAQSSKASEKSYGRRSPARTPEAEENHLINLSMDLARKQLERGTASSQLITHFLKRGSAKEKLEQEILEKQKELISAKTDAIQSAKRIEDLYKDAIKAFGTYSGSSGGDEDADG